MILTYGISEVGTSHVSKGAPCQDSHAYSSLSNGWSVAVIADGVGSAKHSEVASRIACDTFVDFCNDQITSDTIFEDVLGIIKSAFVKAYVGCIAGKVNNILIDSCSNSGSTIEATKYVLDSNVKYAYVGGYVGSGYSITNCTNAVDICYTAGGRYVGGVAGYIGGIGTFNTSNLVNEANITGNCYVGGVFGSIVNDGGAVWDDNFTTNLSSFKNSGNIAADGEYTGGLIGYGYFDHKNGSSTLYISDFENTGNVTGTTYVGGVAGYLYTDSSASGIIDTYSTGTITGTSDYGNIVGEVQNVTVN